jgi:hypothetical protein
MLITHVLSVILPFKHLYTHKKQKQPTPSFWSHKLLFFSVLLAFSQRNSHFCGCKGTHYY